MQNNDHKLKTKAISIDLKLAPIVSFNLAAAVVIELKWHSCNIYCITSSCP